MLTLAPRPSRLHPGNPRKQYKAHKAVKNEILKWSLVLHTKRAIYFNSLKIHVSKEWTQNETFFERAIWSTAWCTRCRFPAKIPPALRTLSLEEVWTVWFQVYKLTFNSKGETIIFLLNLRSLKLFTSTFYKLTVHELTSCGNASGWSSNRLAFSDHRRGNVDKLPFSLSMWRVTMICVRTILSWISYVKAEFKSKEELQTEFAVAVRVFRSNIQNLVISRCCFAEDD